MVFRSLSDPTDDLPGLALAVEQDRRRLARRPGTARVGGVGPRPVAPIVEAAAHVVEQRALGELSATLPVRALCGTSGSPSVVPTSRRGAAPPPAPTSQRCFTRRRRTHEQGHPRHHRQQVHRLEREAGRTGSRWPRSATPRSERRRTPATAPARRTRAGSRPGTRCPPGTPITAAFFTAHRPRWSPQTGEDGSWLSRKPNVRPRPATTGRSTARRRRARRRRGDDASARHGRRTVAAPERSATSHATASSTDDARQPMARPNSRPASTRRSRRAAPRRPSTSAERPHEVTERRGRDPEPRVGGQHQHRPRRPAARRRAAGAPARPQRQDGEGDAGQVDGTEPPTRSSTAVASSCTAAPGLRDTLVVPSSSHVPPARSTLATSMSVP